MSREAFSLFAFGIYMLILGAILVVVPNQLITLFGLPPVTDVWIRIVGMLVFFIGCYDILAARNEWVPFFVLSVYLRIVVFLLLGTFVLLELAPPMIILFGVIDLVTASWTALAVRSGRTRTALGS